jgi:hypothetical protein
MDNIHTNLGNGVNFNNLNTDYKAEIVALNLIKIYKEIDQIFLKRLGNSSRSFKKDINSISASVYEFDETTVSIETFRESIYDYLPEGIFHTPTLGKAYDNIDQVVSQIKKQKEIEDNARKFFEPFELETYFAELGALHMENHYDILEESNLLIETISELWPLLSELDTQTARVFIYLLPFFHSVRGNKRWFEKCLMAFLKVPVNITFIPNIIKNTDTISDVVGNVDPQLGISTVLSGDHMDGQRNWCINIGPIPYEVLDQYVPQSGLRKLLNRLYDFCIPLNIEVIEEFITEKDEESFRLSDDGNTSILGYSTFL